MSMPFLNKLLVKAIFSDAPELNLTAFDMGEEMVNISFDENVVNRVRTATGAMGSLSIFIPVTATVSIAKSSPAFDNYKKRILSNGYIGGTLTIYDDVNEKWVLEEVSINPQNIGALNGTIANFDFQLQGNMQVNKDALAPFM